MKNLFYIIFFLIELPVVAQNITTETNKSIIGRDSLILMNEVEIINEELLNILEKRVFPYLLDWDQFIEISMEYNEQDNTSLIYIILRFLSFVTIEEWNSYDGYFWNSKEKVIIMFKGCIDKNIIIPKKDVVPRTVPNSNIFATQDWRVWVYEFKNNKFRFIERY